MSQSAAPNTCRAVTSYVSLRAEYMADQTASGWLKGAIKILEHRDPVDALNDLEALHRLAELRLQNIVEGASG